MYHLIEILVTLFSDPELTVPDELTSAVKAMIIGIGVGVGCLIIIIAVVIGILWCMKSKQRKKERFERTASMRSSLNNLTKINSSLRGTRSTLTGFSVGASRQRLNDLENRSLGSSFDKNSQRSAVSSEANKSEQSTHYSDEVNQNSQTVPESKRAKPIHSLRPDRSKAGRKNQGLAEHVKPQNREKEKERKKYRYSRDDETDEDEKYSDNSDEYSDEKKSLDSDSTSEENSVSDEEVDSRDKATKNKQSPLRKSSEQLLKKPLVPGKARYDLLIQPNISKQEDNPGSRYKNKSLSIFTDNVESQASNVLLPRSTSKEGLLAKPADQKRPQEVSTQVKPSPKPAPRPKPPPPIRKPVNGDKDQPQQNAALLPLKPQEETIDSRDHLYTNKQGSQPLKKMPAAKQEDRSLVHYNVKDPSQNVNMYDPIDYNTTVKSQYAFDQKPDTDYMPRPLGNPALGLSRERLDDTSSLSSKSSSIFKSDVDSVVSSIKPYKPLPPKPGASSTSSRFLPSVSSLDSKYSKDSMSTQLPPYSPPPVLQPAKAQSREKLNQTRREHLEEQPPPPILQPARSQSHERLNQTRRSREHLDEQPPHALSKERLQPRQFGGSRDVLYLAQGGKPNNDSVETQI